MTLVRTVVWAPLLVVAVGCPPGPVPEGLPGGAELAQESGAVLRFTARASGTIYVRDQPADWIIFESPVDAGQTVVVDGEANLLTVDGRPRTPRTILRPDATYQLFFRGAGR